MEAYDIPHAFGDLGEVEFRDADLAPSAAALGFGEGFDGGAVVEELAGVILVDVERLACSGREGVGRSRAAPFGLGEAATAAATRQPQPSDPALGVPTLAPWVETTYATR